MKKFYTEEEVFILLVDTVIKEGRKEFAKRVGISLPYLHDIMHKNRGISEKTAAVLGLTRCWVKK